AISSKFASSLSRRPPCRKNLAGCGRNDRRSSFLPRTTEKRAMRFEEELVDLLPRLRRFARGLTQSASDADDLCQAAIERALKSREQWQRGTRLDSWMYRITRNLWIDDRRAAARRGVHTPIDDAVTQIAGDGVAEVEA